MDQINNRQEIVNLADFLLRNDKFFYEFSWVVRTEINIEGFEKWQFNYRLKKGMPLGKKDQQFFNLLSAVYDIAKETNEKFTQDELLGLIRGSVFEVYVRKMIEKRYQGEIHTNCCVKIEKNYIQPSSLGSPPKVDIGLYDNVKQAEMYECKVGTKYFTSSKLKFLTLLGETLIKYDGLDFVVAGVSMADQKELARRFFKLGHKDVVSFGRGNLQKLSNFKEAMGFAQQMGYYLRP